MSSLNLRRFAAAAVIALVTLSIGKPLDAAVNRVWIRGAGTSNWGVGSNWSPTGAPQPGDGVFITATDSFAKTVILDGFTFASTHNYQQVFIDESGPGSMMLLQVDLQLVATLLNVGVSGTATYNLSGGTGIFNNATLGSAGVLAIGTSGRLNAGIFRQIAGNLTMNGTMNCTSFTMSGGSLTNTGSYTGFNFTQSIGSIFTNQTISLTGTYTYNSGVFGEFNGTIGGVSCGTFIDNAGTFAGHVDAGRLIVNGNGTFLNGVINRGPLIVAAPQTIWADQYFDQIGGTVTQSGFVGGDLPGGISSVESFITIGGGAIWNQVAGRLQARSMMVGSGNGGPGFYNLSGTGSAQFSGFGVGGESDGSVVQSAGYVKANSVVLGGYAGAFRGSDPGPGQRAFYQLAGGSLEATSLILAPTDSISGTFIQTGGQTLIDRLQANLDNTSTSIIRIEGGTFVADEVSINGGSFTQTGGFVYFVKDLNGSGDMTVAGTGSMLINRIRQDSLAMGGNGLVNIGQLALSTTAFVGTTNRVESLTFEQNGGTIQGTLNMGVSDLVVDYDTASPIVSIGQYIASGRAGGNWTGPGITSGTAAGHLGETALGFAESSSIFGPSGGVFGGLAVDATAVLIKYTYYGDADLDGDVDIADLGALASNWQAAGTWRSGDFDYDGAVSVNDLGLLASNWQAGVGNPLGPSLEQSLAALGLPHVSVPEPQAFVPITLLFFSQMRARYRRVH
jgi:hypothetical protein